MPMIEREMEDLLYAHPDVLLGEALKPVARQSSSAVGRSDLIFEHPHGYRLIVEVKAGVAPRGVGDQLYDYWGAEKQAHPDVPVEMMVVANEIPRERRLFLCNRNIEPREISTKTFRDVAVRFGYTFESEDALRKLATGDDKKRGLQHPTGFEHVNLAASTDLLALFVALSPTNLEKAFDRFAQGGDEVWLGTDCKLVTAKKDLKPGAGVYFKAKSADQVTARAQLTFIRQHPDMPPGHLRLSGYEHTENKYYYGVRLLHRLRDPIPVTALVCRSTNKHLNKFAGQCELIIHAPVLKTLATGS